MRLATRSVLFITYYYSMLLGVFPFIYNYERKLVYSKPLLTLYSTALNFLTVASLPLIVRLSAVGQGQMRIRLLHELIYAIMCLVRVLSLVLTLLRNLRRRQDFLAAIRGYHELQTRFFRHLKVNARLQRKYEYSMLVKFCCALAMDLSSFLLAVDLLRFSMTWESFSGLGMISVMSTIVTVCINHYFFSILHINLLFKLLDEELQRILTEARLTEGKRPGFFINRCCHLADELDELAIAYDEVLKWANCVNELNTVTGFCMAITWYLTNICTQYFVFSYVRNTFGTAAAFSAFGLSCLIVNMITYYADLTLFTGLILEMVEISDATGHILRLNLPIHLLDERLEQSVSNISKFCFQITFNPLEMDLLGLFKFHKPMLLSIFSSTIMHSVFMMQYDYGNF